MIPARFDYVKPGSVGEAVQALASGGEDAKVIAGGQSLLPLLRLRLAYLDLLVDVGALDELRGVADVGKALHDHAALAPCLARRVYAYGVGRNPGTADRKWIAWLARSFASDHYRLVDLLRTIVESDAFTGSASAAGNGPVMASN